MNNYPQPLLTVDVVLLTLHQGILMTALVQRDKEPRAGDWTLPGGFVHPDEDVDDYEAAQRILATKAGMVSPYLEQLHTFASRYRDSRGWSASIAYYALVPFTDEIKGLSSVRWVPVDELRVLPFDHMRILEMAVSRVRSKTLYSSLPVHLMPEQFTLPQLQQVYEHLLASTVDKRTFRRRIDDLDIIEEIPGAFTSGTGRPAQLYRRKDKKDLALAKSNLGVKHG